MRLTILGSGTYQPELERHGSAYLIETENPPAGGKICFDFGRGAIEQLLKVGIQITEIGAIFISHWHSDHIADLTSLLHYTTAPLPDKLSNIPARKNPLKIYGPEGTLENIKKLLQIIHYGDDSLNNIEVKEIAEDKIAGDGWTVWSYPTVHNADSKPICYRLESEGKVFAYSGDSIASDSLKKAVKDADLAVIEAGWPSEVNPKTHMTGQKAGKIAQDEGVKKLIITHMSPYFLKNFDPIKETKETFSGEVILAKDLLEIEV